jgi:hypothetical protein
LLEQLQQKEPQNAAVATERARAAFLLHGKPGEGFDRFREVARLREFSRSYLVATPAPLRHVLKFHPGLREMIQEGWPGYRHLFLTLRPAMPLRETESERLQRLLLSLQVADKLCEAEDYADQAVGIDQKTSTLRDLAELGRKLPPEQRALIQSQRERHESAFATFPRSVQRMFISKNGLKRMEHPSLGPHPIGDEGPTVFLNPSGTLMFAPDLRRYGAP